MTTIRADVVRLVLDIDTSTTGEITSTGPVAIYRAHLDARRLDGRPLTEAEAALIATVTSDEARYAGHLISLHKQAHAAAAADFERMQYLMGYYVAELESTASVGEFLACIPAYEQAEFEMLMDRVNGYPSEETAYFDAYRRALAELDA